MTPLPRGYRFLPALAVALFFVAPAPVAPGGTDGAGVTPAAAESSRLSTFRTRHYHVHTNAPVAEAIKVAAHMDAVFAEYARRFAAFTPKSDQHMPLYLLASQQDYIDFLKSHDIDGGGTGGIFFIRPTVRGLATWLDDRPPWVTLETLQHEGFHQFTHAYIGGKLPLWVNEGLAEYFADAVLVRDRLRIGFASGRRIEAVRRALDNDDVIDLDELMATPAGKWQLNLIRAPGKGRMQYEQSWSMVHFLIHAEQGRYRDAFERYLRLIAQGMPDRAAFQHAFGADDTIAFRRQWEKWAAHAEPDPLDTAVSRMRFIAQGLLLLKDRREPMPRNTDELRRRLTEMGFRAIRIENGIRTEVAASDMTLYVYEHTTGGRGGVGTFTLVSPPRADLPPRITAPGMQPQPTLTWTMDKEGKAVATVDYR